jgi:hypothetical protein
MLIGLAVAGIDFVFSGKLEGGALLQVGLEGISSISEQNFDKVGEAGRGGIVEGGSALVGTPGRGVGVCSALKEQLSKGKVFIVNGPVKCSESLIIRLVVDVCPMV